MPYTPKIYTKEEIAAFRKTILDEIKKQFPYETPRPNQVLVVYNIVKAFMEGKKFFILEASTGFGKSVAGVVAMKVISSLFPYENDEGQELHHSSLVCTKTKALQKQYAKDYSDFSSLWSSSGYECNRDPKNKEAYFGSHECDKKLCFYYNECNYRIAREEFLLSAQGILNYAYFMHFASHKPGLLVLDEAHNLEKVLVDHLHIKINPNYIKTVLEKLEKFDVASAYHTRTIYDSLNDIAQIYDTKDNWFKDIKRICSEIAPIICNVIDKYEEAKKMIDENKLTFSTDERKVLFFNGNMLDSLYSKLSRLITSNVEWVISERDATTSIDLKPISLAEEANFMFSRSKFIILMSATICGIPLFCQTLGIKDTDYASISLDSDVPIENRQIVPVGLTGMSMKNRLEVLPMYVQVMDSLIDKYGTKVRGLIHSVTYENAEYIVKNSKYKKRMIVPQTEDVIEIKKLLDKRPEAIIVTPAMTEGSDLSGDYCRFIFFFKIPFPYLGDKWVSRKKDINNDWYIRETINQVVQGCGRGVRYKEDYCITFILDANFNNLRYKNSLMPAWFSNAIVNV